MGTNGSRRSDDMRLYDFATARASRPAHAASTENDGASFDNVYEIETARRARSARIPLSVYEEMEAAAALYEELSEEGRQIRYTHLCDLDGNVIRRLTLREAIAIDTDPDNAA
jgi:hypothetical protein